jgi:hypothetical protein
MTSVSNDEKQLLDNLLDSLDRLYDEQTRVLDVQALLQTTGSAVTESDLQSRLLSASAAVLSIIRAQPDEEARRNHTLIALQPLRERLAALV